MNTFDLIKASTFFPKYANSVNNWSHKMRGMNGRGNPLSFSSEDLTAIKIGMDAMNKDLQKVISMEIKSLKKV